MSILIEKLGIDYKLLLSQVVNFVILLVVLRFAVYKPLLELLEKRRRRIEEGLIKANEADKRLSEISQLQKEKMKEAEVKGLEILKRAEAQANDEGKNILAAAAKKENEIMARAKEKADAATREGMRGLEKEAAQLVHRILEKAVEMAPGAIDDALIQKAAREVQTTQ